MALRSALKRGFYSLQRPIARTYVSLSGGGDSRKFSILALHSISPARSDMAVTADCLSKQLQALLAAGYQPMSLDEIIRAGAEDHPTAGKRFGLTFDDGYESVYTAAMPLLEALQIPVTVFLAVGFLNGDIAPPWHSSDTVLVEEYRREAIHFRPMTWTQAKELAVHPLVRIGSHSVNHYLLALIKEDKLREEVTDSRQILEDRLGVPVEAFSYPYGVARYGAYSQRTEDEVRRGGYLASFTSEFGRPSTGSGSFLLPRIPLTDDDTGADATAKAAGGYDWLTVAQSTYQRIFPNPHIDTKLP